MSKKYISTNKINFNQDFIFSFQWAGKISNPLDLFLIKFSIKTENLENGFQISSILEDYESIENIAIKKKIKPDLNYFLGDEIQIINNVPYKELTTESLDEIKSYIRKNDKLYVHNKNYEIKDGYIIKYNKIDKNKNYIIPISLSKFYNNETDYYIDETDYYIDENNIFDPNLKKIYRIVVSNKAKEITILIKVKDDFQQIKTFTFPDEIVNGLISLEIGKNMILNDLEFSFLDSNIE